jgi:enoyl-CoA hydratase/carnithine racemase
MTTAIDVGLRIARDGPLLILRLDRPNENRLTVGLMRALATAIAAADVDDDVATVAITGTGEWFCGGAEMPVAADGRTEAVLEFGGAWAGLREQCATFGKPLIGAINGRAFAGGLALTALTDLAFAVPSATFGLPELQYGIFPMLVLSMVITELPRKLAFDLIYRGRVLDAEEARRYGLVNDVIDGSAMPGALIETAARIARSNPQAIQLGRRAYGVMSDLNAHSRMEYARHVAANLLATRVAAETYRQRLASSKPEGTG